LYLFSQDNQFLHRVQGKFGGSGWLSRHQGSRLERDAQGHVLTVGNKNVSGTTLEIANLAHGEAPPEERVGGVGDLNLGHIIFKWVLDGGSKLWARSIASITRHCSPNSTHSQHSGEQ
jgi:hypothetical protein